MPLNCINQQKGSTNHWGTSKGCLDNWMAVGSGEAQQQDWRSLRNLHCPGQEGILVFLACLEVLFPQLQSETGEKLSLVNRIKWTNTCLTGSTALGTQSLWLMS